MVQLPDNLDLANPEFLQAWNLVRHTNKSIFLTGKAGTGKSTFLRYICERTKKKFVVLAPTGIAAVNVGGVTIHSFFQMPLRPVPPDDPDYSVSHVLKKLKILWLYLGYLMSLYIFQCHHYLLKNYSLKNIIK